MLSGKKITLAITGGIAAYKCCELVRALRRLGADVWVAMTQHATEFVTPLTFHALSGHPVFVTEWQPGVAGVMPHIELNQGTDLLIVMPATANVIAKAAHGIADDLVSTLIVARRSPMIIVPAMNAYMWQSRANLRNVDRLKADGVCFFGPVCGLQACGDNGAGRMMEPEEITDLVSGFFEKKSLLGRRVLITAGPTYEPIDDVRGITNLSSGRQGFALARAARDAGAEVTLIAGPCALPTPARVSRINVTHAQAMLNAVLEQVNALSPDLFIGVAAVADWRVAKPLSGKIKKAAGVQPTLNFVENPDILATVAALPNAPYCIGFAAEADNIVEYAREKCRTKNVPLIVANVARNALSSLSNEVVLVSPSSQTALGPADKRKIARRIIEFVAPMLPKMPQKHSPQETIK